MTPRTVHKLLRKIHSEGYPEGWRKQLAKLFAGAPQDPIALVGVGHRFRGDDYVGSYMAKSLTKLRHRDGILVLDAGDSPEAFLPKLSGLGLRHVVFIDACEVGAPPGEIRLLPIEDTSYPFFTTHGVPLRVLATQFLAGSKSWILAIQPGRTEFGTNLTPEVRSAAKSIEEFIDLVLRREA